MALLTVGRNDHGGCLCVGESLFYIYLGQLSDSLCYLDMLSADWILRFETGNIIPFFLFCRIPESLNRFICIPVRSTKISQDSSDLGDRNADAAPFHIYSSPLR